MCVNKAVYYLATKDGVDHVAKHVFNQLVDLIEFTELGIEIDDHPVLRYEDNAGNIFDFVSTDKVVCHDYDRYLPAMLKYFSDYTVSGLITWHEGGNAPDRILTVHTTGDVESGNFGNANPKLMHNLLSALERNRQLEGLDDYFVTTEATHWSGMMYGDSTPDKIVDYKVPIMDIEIGSTSESWGNLKAAKVLAASLTEIFNDTGLELMNILCAGGTHFERGFSSELFVNWDGKAYGISHIIPNQWLVSGEYEDESGQLKLENCIQSIIGGIQGIAMHDGLKGIYKQQLRTLGERLHVPVFKHQFLRKPDEIKWNE